MTHQDPSAAWFAWLDAVTELAKADPKVTAVYRGRFTVFPTVFLIGKTSKARQKALTAAIHGLPGTPVNYSVMYGEEPPAGGTLVWRREDP